MSTPVFHVTDSKTDLDMKWLIASIQSSYWGKHLQPLQLMRAVDQSVNVGAYVTATRQMIGICRIVTDRAVFSSVTDLFVDPAWRGKGVGKALAHAAVSHPWVKGTICVLASRDAAGFWARFSFFPANDVMKRGPSP